MNEKKILILAMMVLGLCCGGLMADTIKLEAGIDQCAWSNEAETFGTSHHGYGVFSLSVGNQHGINNQLRAGYVQFDLSAYAGKTVTSDGQFQFYARIAPGMAEQTGGFQVRELDPDWVYDEVCWEEYSEYNEWTTTAAPYWNRGGVGDTVGLIGSFTVTDHNYVLQTMTIPKATIQGWIDGDSTVSFLFAVHEDYYNSYFADKLIDVGAAGAGTPGKPTLTFDCDALTVASVELGNTVYSYEGSAYSSYFDANHGMDFLQVGNHHGINNQLFAGYMQVDMNDVNNIVEIVGDGILRFQARIESGHSEQPGGFQVHELDLDYVQSQCNWNEYSYLNTWTDTGATYWNKAGVGDTNSLIGTFGVVDSNYAPISLSVPESVIQGWVNGTPSSLLWAVHEDYYDSFYADRVINVGADGWYSPYKPTLEFSYVAVPACGDYAHPYPAGDVDKNCIVDMHDIAQMAKDWLDCTTPECD